ncbi:hypothetical protein MLD38_011986 [Melastoma candidum]|uniref:Uncharacterized protein n=1 Tax=Melastoma candidum TaxID=119954 RepID=A0ACB9R4X1_9MYRT|nr:hypothetical protein MLD38_011986 [Melastoma candidum]
MASLLRSDSRRLYSWWWSSHVNPKNSKWLQENLTDMDAKVKAMIKLIEEDADSFARRAEMYYKRRPELIKLVEEFYRAYRALAERYNHVAAELRLAHQTMAEAFPDQLPDSLADDSASSSSVGETDPLLWDVSHSSRDLFDHDASLNSSTNISSGAFKKDTKLVPKVYEFEEVTSQNFGDADEVSSRSSTITEVDRCRQSLQHGLLQLSNVTKDLKLQVISESERASKAEIEVQNIKSILVDLQAEKGSVLSKYQDNMEKVANLERALNHAHEAARVLNEQASKTEIEIKMLKEALTKLQSERDAYLSKYNQSLEMISGHEIKLSIAQEKENSEYRKLRDELSILEDEKEAGLFQYQQSLETIAALEKKISDLELEVKCLSKQTFWAESEIAELRLAVSNSNEEKEAVAERYKQCLERLAKLEGELSCAQEDARRLNDEVVQGAEKLKSSEKQCVTLEQSNRNLQGEAENLAQKYSIKAQELSQKQVELESLQRDEHLRFVDIEACLKTFEKLYRQSQEEQRTLASEIKSGFQMLKDLETRKTGLEEEIQWIKEENQSLSAKNASFLVSDNSLRAELFALNETKEKLEREFIVQAEKTSTLEHEIHQLREETQGLNQCYEDLLLQLESVGLNPRSVAAAVLKLRNENCKLHEMNQRNIDQKEAVSKKFDNVNMMSEKNSILETSLSQLNCVLKDSRENVKILEESCRILQEEKSCIIAEKTVLVSQLQTITKSMENLVKKNSSLENSLTAARIEIDSLKDCSRRLEEFSVLLMKEKSHLVAERSSLALQLDKVEKRLESLEKRFNDLEERCIRLEREKETTLFQVEELKGYLDSEKQEHIAYVQSSEVCLAGLENQVLSLQDEIELKKREFEEEIEKAVNSQVEIFMLKNLVEDLEEDNISLLVECERHVEARKLSTKLISEMESENLEHQIEAEMLAGEVERLNTEIFQIFRALQVVPKSGLKEDRLLQIPSSYHDQVPVRHMLKSIEHLKCSLSKIKDEEDRLLIENLVLFDILEEIRLECADLSLEKYFLKEDLRIMSEQYRTSEKDKNEIFETMRHLEVQLIKEGEQREALQNEFANVNDNLTNIQRDYQLLQEKIMSVLSEKEILSKKIMVAEKQLHSNEEENCALLHEVSALGNLCLIFQIIGAEKMEQLKGLSEELLLIHSKDLNLKKNLDLLDEKLQSERAENLSLVCTVGALSSELDQVKDLNDRLNHQILDGDKFLREKAEELSEADQNLELSRFLTPELSRHVQDLLKEHKESKMDKGNVDKWMVDFLDEQVKCDGKIKVLLQVNKKQQWEAETLRRAVKECRIKEEIPRLELQDRCNKFELCEAEAASLYFILQISAVREVLLESKVQELMAACVSLRDGGNVESGEIDKMKKRVGPLESEMGGLRSKVSAYAPIICSFADGSPSFQQTPSPKPKDADSKYQFGESEMQKLKECESMTSPEVSHLQKMQDRIEAIGMAAMEDARKLKGQNDKDIPASVSDAMRGTGHSEVENVSSDCYGFHKENKHSGRLKNSLLMKDIPLDENSDSSPRGRGSRLSSSEDQIIGLESAKCDVKKQKPLSAASGRSPVSQLEDAWKRGVDPSLESQIEKDLPIDKISSFREMDKEMNRKKILEMVTSDAQKLRSLRIIVDDLKMKAEMKKRRKKPQLMKYEMVKRHLHEVEEVIGHLVVINDHSMKNANKDDSGDTNREELRERARKESEKINSLQFQVQNINNVLLKIKDQKKPKLKSNQMFCGTGVLLRDFIYHNGSRSGDRRKRKSCFCGCATPRTKGE